MSNMETGNKVSWPFMIEMFPEDISTEHIS